MKNIIDLHQAKANKQKITWVTCYDYWTANILKETDVDVLLVGDSVSMVVHGFESTIHANVEMMALHTAAVARAKPNKLIVSDLPFLVHRSDRKTLMDAVDRLMKAGAQALKIETAPGQEDIVQWLSESGIPMIGHLGLTPQYVHQFGGYKVQGRDEISHKKIVEQATRLEEAGCHALVLECVPNTLAAEITGQSQIPTIGIGAGTEVDGQVLVLQDLLGFNKEFKPRFVRNFAQGFDWMSGAVKNYAQSVRSIEFPRDEESFQ